MLSFAQRSSRPSRRILTRLPEQISQHTDTMAVHLQDAVLRESLGSYLGLGQPVLRRGRWRNVGRGRAGVAVAECAVAPILSRLEHEAYHILRRQPRLTDPVNVKKLCPRIPVNRFTEFGSNKNLCAQKFTPAILQLQHSLGV